MIVLPKDPDLRDYEEFYTHLNDSIFCMSTIQEFKEFWAISKVRYHCSLEADFKPGEWIYNDKKGKTLIKIFGYRDSAKTVIILGEVISNRCFLYGMISDFMMRKICITPIFYDYDYNRFFISLYDKLEDDNFDYCGFYHNTLINPWDEPLPDPYSHSKMGNVETVWRPVKYKIPLYQFAVPIVDLLKFMDPDEHSLIKFLYESNRTVSTRWVQEDDEWSEQTEYYRGSFLPEWRDDN